MNAQRTDRPGRLASLVRRRRQVLRVTAVVGLVASVGASALWLTVFDGRGVVARAANDTYLRVSAATGLVVQEIRLSGRKNAERPALMAAIGIARDAPILSVDLDRLRERIENLGWVAEAQVARRLPNVIEIAIAERMPFARWQNDGRLFVIDRSGAVVTGHQLERYDALPLVVGPDAPASAAALIDLMTSDPSLSARVTAAVRVGGRRWNLRIDNGVDVLLPEEGISGAWQRLGTLQREQSILERDVTVIDLRLADRVFMRLPSDTAASVRDPGEST